MYPSGITGGGYDTLRKSWWLGNRRRQIWAISFCWFHGPMAFYSVGQLSSIPGPAQSDLLNKYEGWAWTGWQWRRGRGWSVGQVGIFTANNYSYSLYKVLSTYIGINNYHLIYGHWRVNFPPEVLWSILSLRYKDRELKKGLASPLDMKHGTKSNIKFLPCCGYLCFPTLLSRGRSHKERYYWYPIDHRRFHGWWYC